MHVVCAVWLLLLFVLCLLAFLLAAAAAERFLWNFIFCKFLPSSE
jgi:hypothetical protein